MAGTGSNSLWYITASAWRRSIRSSSSSSNTAALFFLAPPPPRPFAFRDTGAALFFLVRPPLRAPVPLLRATRGPPPRPPPRPRPLHRARGPPLPSSRWYVRRCLCTFARALHCRIIDHVENYVKLWWKPCQRSRSIENSKFWITKSRNWKWIFGTLYMQRARNSIYLELYICSERGTENEYLNHKIMTSLIKDHQYEITLEIN